MTPRSLAKRLVDNAKETLRCGAALTAYATQRRHKTKREPDARPVIAYDGTPLTHAVKGVPNLTGIERYLMELAVHVARGDQFAVRIYTPLEFSSPSLRALFRPGEHIVCGSAIRWMRQIGGAIARGEIDLYHLHGPDVLPSQAMPAWLAPRRAVTIYDQIPLHFPYKSPRSTQAYRKRLQQLAQKADALIFISDYTRRDFVEQIGEPRGLSRVIYLGIGSQFVPCPDPARIQEVRDRYNLPEHFVLTLGRAALHKNMPALVRAVKRVRENGSDTKLVIAGPLDNLEGSRDLRKVIEELDAASWALPVGVVEDNDLSVLYSAADLFCLPSLMEGFGFPVAEAMACGCPVVCSNRASLPEVAGDAAILVNPEEVEDIARGLERVLSDSALRTELREKGLRQAAKFTWAETVRQTEQVYAEVLGLPGAAGE